MKKKKCFFLLLCSFAFVIFLTFNFFDFLKNRVAPPKPFDEFPNNYLDNAERLLEGRVWGPEHLITNGKDIYATLHNEVVRINGEHITHVAKFGKPCGKS